MIRTPGLDKNAGRERENISESNWRPSKNASTVWGNWRRNPALVLPGGCFRTELLQNDSLLLLLRRSRLRFWDSHSQVTLDSIHADTAAPTDNLGKVVGEGIDATLHRNTADRVHYLHTAWCFSRVAQPKKTTTNIGVVWQLTMTRTRPFRCECLFFSPTGIQTWTFVLSETIRFSLHRCPLISSFVSLMGSFPVFDCVQCCGVITENNFLTFQDEANHQGRGSKNL